MDHENNYVLYLHVRLCGKKQASEQIFFMGKRRQFNDKNVYVDVVSY